MNQLPPDVIATVGAADDQQMLGPLTSSHSSSPPSAPAGSDPDGETQRLLFRVKIGIFVGAVLVFGLVYWLVATQARREGGSGMLRRDVLQALSAQVDVVSAASLGSDDGERVRGRAECNM